MKVHVNSGGQWHEVKTFWINERGVWRECTAEECAAAVLNHQRRMSRWWLLALLPGLLAPIIRLFLC